LEELTRRLQGGPVAAEGDLVIESGLVRGRELDHLYFRGEVRRLGMASVLARFGLPGIGGSVGLKVDGGRIENATLQRLWVTGEWFDGSLQALARALLGRDTIQGQLRVKVNSLTVQGEQILSGD